MWANFRKLPFPDVQNWCTLREDTCQILRVKFSGLKLPNLVAKCNGTLCHGPVLGCDSEMSQRTPMLSFHQRSGVASPAQPGYSDVMSCPVLLPSFYSAKLWALVSMCRESPFVYNYNNISMTWLQELVFGLTVLSFFMDSVLICFTYY